MCLQLTLRIGLDEADYLYATAQTFPMNFC